MRKLNAQTDLCKGNIMKALITFSIPILLSSIFQQLYGAADAVIIGRKYDETTLAAFGVCTPIIDMIIGFAIGVGSGFSIVVAQSYGAGDKERVKKTVAGSIVIGAVITLIISVFASVFMYPLLRLFRVQDDLIHQAHSYITVLVACTAVLVAYNLCAGFLRAIGNSFAPLIFLIIASLLNIILALLFVAVLDLGVMGASVATVIAQGFSALMCIIYIKKKCPELVPKKEHFRIDGTLYKALLSQGLSFGLMLSIVAFGSVMLQSAVNGFDTMVITGHTAARRIHNICMIPFGTIMITVSTFVSQNKGLGQSERIRKGIKYGIFISVVCGLILTAFFMFAAPLSIRLISNSKEDTVIRNGSQYLRINPPFYMILGMVLVLRSSLQSVGNKVLPVVSSVIELAGKIVFALFFVPRIGYLGVSLCEPVIWCLMLIQLSFAAYNNPYFRDKNKKLLRPSNNIS